MYSVIREKTKRDRQFPERYYNLFIYQKILEGTLYDCFQYGYYQQYVGRQRPQYIEETQRAPSSNSGLNLMRSVVEESVSFVFGEDRFPKVNCEDESVQEWCKNVVEDCHLQHLMAESAFKGSIGSSAIQVRVFQNQFYPVVHWT